jgi:hypothetical protein
MMRIPSRAISLAAALVLGVAIVGMSTGEAEAKPRHPKDAGVRCVLQDQSPDEDYTFYLPGEYVAHPDGSGTILQCGNDGHWHEFK